MKISDLVINPHRSNMGTERGAQLLRESVESCGYGRAVVVDKNGVVIAGNKTVEAAIASGAAVTVVETSGHELVVVQREDLDLLESTRARQLAYYDNRTTEVGLSWSPKQVQTDMLEGVDLTSSFFPEEIDRVMALAVVDTEGIVDVEVAPELTTADVAALAEPKAPKAEPAEKAPSLYHEITFDNQRQHLRWIALMRALRVRYPDEWSQPARLAAHLARQVEA